MAGESIIQWEVEFAAESKLAKSLKPRMNHKVQHMCIYKSRMCMNSAVFYVYACLHMYNHHIDATYL